MIFQTQRNGIFFSMFRLIENFTGRVKDRNNDHKTISTLDWQKEMFFSFQKFNWKMEDVKEQADSRNVWSRGGKVSKTLTTKKWSTFSISKKKICETSGRKELLRRIHEGTKRLTEKSVSSKMSLRTFCRKFWINKSSTIIKLHLKRLMDSTKLVIRNFIAFFRVGKIQKVLFQKGRKIDNWCIESRKIIETVSFQFRTLDD